MQRDVSKFLALVVLAGACGGAKPHTTAPTSGPTETAALHKGLNIKLANVYVDDQEKCLRFYSDVLGFAKKDDETNGSFRWLTVTAPGDTEGTALLLDGAVGALDSALRELTAIRRDNPITLEQLIEPLLHFSAWQARHA